MINFATSCIFERAQTTHTHLVLHGTRIKVVHCNNVVHVQVVLQPERVLVPPHRLLQARHGMIQLGHVARLREDFQMNLPSGRSGGVCGGDGPEIARLERERERERESKK